MALPNATPASPHNPQVVGAAFVGQYYQVLHSTPEVVYKFYQESSILSRPDPNGEMSQVTTLHGINEKILSFKFNSYIAEIETVDSLASYKDGVFIVVTGCLTSSDNTRRKFSQSFFLAPQDKGYFVLNDIFRFVDQSQPTESNQILDNGDSVDAPGDPLSAAAEPSLVQENHVEESATPDLEEDLANNEDMVDPSESYGSGVEDEVDTVSPAQQSLSGDQPNQMAATSVVQDDGPKKSYASIVKVMGNTPPRKNSAPAIKAKAKAASPSTASTEKPLNIATNPATASEPKAPSSNNGHDDVSPDVEGYSIHIRNLPSNTTTTLVEEELKKFGPIRPGGVQVRNHKVDNFCYGFVEYESLSSMQAAIKASPIYIGRYPSYIEEKRTTTRVINGVVISSNNGRGRFPQARGGFRNNDNFRGNDGFRGNDNFRGNDGFRGNDNFRGNDGFRGNNSMRGIVDGFRGRDGSAGGNNYGYGRMDFRNRGEYAGRGRGRGPPGNAREGYQQRPIQNGNGKVARPVVAAA